MSPNDDNLGPPSEWQIRRFPTHLREQVVAAARREGVPVHEFLTSLLLVAREAGWPRAVGAAKPHPQTMLNGPDEGLQPVIASALAVAAMQSPRARARLLAAAARHLTTRLEGPA